MSGLLIVWHSLTGGSRAMAEAAGDGAREHGPVRLLAARDADAEAMLAAQGYLFVAPENLASLAGVMKDFFDRTYYPLLGHIEGRPYASLICAGSDGEGAARQLARIATGWRLKAVADPLIICTHAQSEAAIMAAKVLGKDDLVACRERGELLGAGLAMGVF
jgi:NAD(P)H-dependent FMN reductase